MKLTNNVKIFAAINTVTSLMFFWLLDDAITTEQWDRIWTIAIVYGLTWFTSGLILGKYDSTRDYRGDLGMLYHLVTTVVVFVTAIVAVLVFEAFSYIDLLIGGAAMLISLFSHWFGVRGSIKGIDKKEAFK